MKKLLVVVLFTAAVIWAPTAQATTREITGGSIASNALGSRDSFAGLAGPGWSAQGQITGIFYVGGAFFGFGFDFNPAAILPTQITVDGVTCMPATNSFPGDPCTGAVFMTMAPFPPLQPGFSGTEPFTATGHINVGDGFDIVGQGFVTLTSCPGCDFGFPTASFDFVVPEPSTLMLTSIGLGVVGVAWRKARRRENVSSIGSTQLKAAPWQRRVATTP
jgi:PEP-CTERM motif-containing protein